MSNQLSNGLLARRRRIIEVTNVPTRAFGGNGAGTLGGANYAATLNNLGADGATRRIIFATSSASTPPSSVVIGGVTATYCGTQLRNSTSISFYTALVPSGTSVTAEVFGAGSSGGLVWWSWWISEYLTSGSPVDIKGTINSNTLSVNLNVLADGVVCAFYWVGFGTSPGSLNWTGVTSDFQYDPFTQTKIAGASRIMTSTNASYGVSASFNYSANALLAISLR